MGWKAICVVRTRLEDPGSVDFLGSRYRQARASHLHASMLCGLATVLIGVLSIPASAEKQVLKWAGPERDSHPCLYVTASDVARLKKTRRDLTALAAKTSWSLESDGMDKLVAAALLAGNPAAEETVIAEALKNLDVLIGRIPDTTLKNVGPHGYARFFGRAAGLSDAALASKRTTPQQRSEILAKLARAGYLLNDPKYWNPETGKCNLCPNITTTAYYYRLAIAALIPSHPKAKQWFDAAWQEMKREIQEWMDPAGGMLECPHYSMVMFDQWVGACLIARHAGVPESDTIYNPQLRKAMQWFGNLSTPRDPRSEGFRRFPTIGHTYANERTSEFGLIAFLWKNKDPQFASNMQWMYREHGSVELPGLFTYFPALMGYREFLTDPGIRPKVPAWASACYPETGVVLRNTIGSDRETMLYLIAGRNHSHYFNDSGSITLWGKGRELCDEDDYQNRRGDEARSVHSMPDKPATFNGERVMAIREFSTSNDLDYVWGTRRGWQRQIAFVKDRNPLGPNYFVLADTFDDKSVPTTWRLFLAADRITSKDSAVTVVGRDDVDMDIFFLSPGRVKLATHSNHVSVAIGTPGTLTAVLYPRLKTDKRPQVTALDGGRGAKVVTPTGTDYVFLGPEPITFNEGGIEFEGKVGLIKFRKGRQFKSVPGPCDVAPGWEGGDRELRMIRWKGPQYPVFPDE